MGTLRGFLVAGGGHHDFWSGPLARFVRRGSQPMRTQAARTDCERRATIRRSLVLVIVA